MKRMLTLLAALVLLACPVMAEETGVQAEANAAYAAVLLTGADYSPMNEEVLPLKESRPVRFAVMDMNGDGVAEVVLEVEAPEGFLILTYHEGRVYVGEEVQRGLLDLKDDGTSSFSSGAMDNGVWDFCFVVEEDTGRPVGIGHYVLAESRSSDDGSVAYVLDGGQKTTDEAGYRAYLAEHAAKLDALWYDYTEETVKMLLGQ